MLVYYWHGFVSCRGCGGFNSLYSLEAFAGETDPKVMLMLMIVNRIYCGDDDDNDDVDDIDNDDLWHTIILGL